MPLNNALTAAPAYDDTRAFLPLEGNQLIAFDVIGRRVLWTAAIATTVEPVVGDGLIYIIEAESIAALRPDSGEVAWRVPFDEMLAVPPALSGDWLVTATLSGDVSARHARDGVVVWHQQLGAPAHARPTVAGSRVFVSTADSFVHALNRDTGAVLWKRRLGGPGNDILATDERLYLGSRDRYFYCLNATTGAVEWRWATGANVIGLPVIDEQSVYFVSLDNVLRALNRSSGVQRWKSPLPLRPTTGPIRSSMTLVVAGAAPGLKAYTVKDGKPAGQSATAGELTAPVHLVNDPSLPFPILLAATADITGRATVTAYTRTVEPEIVTLGPLPNPVAVGSAVELPKDLGEVIPLPNLSPVSPAAGP
jgi:eukaryotic-like serine/threonine-protein kinase